MKQATITITVDLESADKFGVKIVNAELPNGWTWGATTAMFRHNILPIKKATKETPSAPVSLRQEPIQEMANPANLLDLLRQALAAQMPQQAPQQRKRGRPRKTA